MATFPFSCRARGVVIALVAGVAATGTALAADSETEASLEALLLDNGWSSTPLAAADALDVLAEEEAPDVGDVFAEEQLGPVAPSPIAALPSWVEPSPIVRPSLLAIDEFQLQDAVDVVVIDRRVVAFDARGTGQIGVLLELGEQVLSTSALGRVGVAITDRRVLGVSADVFSWREQRFQVREEPLYDIVLGQRVALLVTNRRAIGFDGGSGTWLEKSFSPRERVLRVRVGPSTGIVVTNRRALAVSPESGGFFEQNLELRERLEDVTAGVGVATITTSRRVLVFRGFSGVWTSQRRTLN